jgi:hypothetical protein
MNKQQKETKAGHNKEETKERRKSLGRKKRNKES